MNFSNPIKNTNAATLVSGTSSSNYIINSVAERNGKVTIDAGAGDDYIADNSRVSSVNAGAGNDTVDHMGQNSTILGGTGNDSIRNSGQLTWIEGGTGKDTIVNTGHQATVDGGDGNDFIDNTNGRSAGDSSVLLGGKGNDTISNGDVGGYGVSIDGGEGNDIIKHNSISSTINAGVGNNLISLSGAAYDNVIIYGGGNDTIVGFNASNVIDLNNATITNRETISGALKLTTSITGGSGSIIINNAANLSVELEHVAKDLSSDAASGSGANNITNTKHNTLITGTSGADTIFNNGGANVTIKALAGDDEITYKFGTAQYIDAGEGNDTLWYDDKNASGQYYPDNTTILAGPGNDVMEVGGRYDCVDAGDGDDSIATAYWFSNYSTISAGAGNDTINNRYGGYYSFLNGDSGDDYILSYAGNLTVNGGEGKDTLLACSGKSVINGGDGDDSIRALTSDMTISGDKGNDMISIVGGAKGNIINYAAGDGNDTVCNYTSDTTVHITSGAITEHAVSGNDLVLTVSDGSQTGTVTFKDMGKSNVIVVDKDGVASTVGGSLNVANTTGNTLITGTGNADSITNKNASNVTINTNDGDDYVYNYTSITGGGNVTINTGKGNDTIRNVAYDITTNTKGIALDAGDDDDYIYNQNATAVTIEGGSGNDSITNENAGKSSINAGAGDDTLNGGIGNDKLNGGAGDDMLLSSAGNDTLTGGAGNDTFQYASGDGNDVITDFATGNDVFKLTSGEVTNVTTSKKNSDVVLTVGKGKVTFKDALSKTITVEDKDGKIHSIVGGVNVIEVEEANSSTTGLGGSDSIKSEYHSKVSIYGGAGNDTIINRAYVYTYGLLDGGAGNDYIHDIYSYYDTIIGGAGNDTDDIFGWGGGTVVDAGAGNDSIGIDNGGGVSVDAGAGNDVIHAIATENTINGGKGNDTVVCDTKQDFIIHPNIIQYASGDGNDVIDNYTEDAAILQITSGEVTKVATGGKKNPTDVVFTIGKGTVTFKGAAGKNISIIDSKGNQTTRTYGDTLVAITDSAGDTVDVSKDSVVLAIDGTERTKPVTIIGNTKANTIISGKGSDTLIGGKGNDVFVYSGGNDVITDYSTGKNVIQFSSDTYLLDASVSGSDMVFYTSTGNLTLLNTVKTNKKGDITGSKITVIDADGVNTGAQLYDMATISPANGDGDTIKANIEVTTINAVKRSKAAYLIGNGNDNTITGGSKNDTIVSMSGNDVVTGGKGKDLFVFDATSGSDTITDYTAKQDSITIAAGVYADYTVDGKNVIMTFTDASSNTLANTLTILNGKDKIITVNGKDDTYNDKTELVLTKNDSGKFDMNDAKYSLIKTVDGTKTTKGVELIANNNGNTLMGGKGKDILTGGLGADTFVYTTGGGNDTIKSYVAGEDVIQLGKKTTISKAAVVEVKDTEGNVTQANYVFTIGKGKLTVEDGATKPITFIDSDGNSIRYDANYISALAPAFEERFYAEELESILTDSKEIAVDYTSTIKDSLNQPAIPLTTNKPNNK